MDLKERVYSVLLVSASSNFNTAIRELLPSSCYQPFCTAASISEAKRLLSDRNWDFILINAPLPDDFGTRFAIDCCRSKETVVLLLAKSDIYAGIHDKVSDYGVFTLPKPTSRSTLQQAFRWMESARERLRRLEKKTASIEERMEEIRLINRAKCLLISELTMTEPQAHRYIEKNAMDNCITKREAANHIIALYSRER